jgi:serine/threonine-protein kinase HipA
MTCLYCYKESDTDFHPQCSKKLFGTPEPPKVPYTDKDLLKLAQQMIQGRTTITGVQPKLSLQIEKPDNQPQKLTIVGLWGEYILKPQSSLWPELPENEDLTMQMAQASNIRTADHSLIKLESGEFAYITKRMDRSKGGKVHMEDMCQLLGRLTEDKYKSSHEQIAKVIKLHSMNPGLDLVRFYDLVIFSFLTGNADMHLKNFSLIQNEDGKHQLSPAYDLVSTALVVKEDDEELALTLCGKKKRLRKADFLLAMKTAGIPDKAAENILAKHAALLNQRLELVDASFLSDEKKADYKTILKAKHKQLYK